MFVIHEGEIVLKEKYGSKFPERFYVKPPDQANILMKDDEKPREAVTNWFQSIFLPKGYPDSVSKDYMAYQMWDTAQAFCSTITGTLATQEVLRGVGVGDNTATPLAATATWVVKDGCGHFGRILFAYSHGTYLDAYSKKWRLYADTLNDAAMCIEIALPLFKNYTLFALCVSTIMKAIVGVAGGATRIAMTQHHAVRGNLADVSAKDAAQETAVNFVASFVALFILTVFGNSLIIFGLMIVLHIACNYFAVRAVCLRTLNDTRFLQVIDAYLKKEVITATCSVNRTEPIIFYQLGPNLMDLKLCGFQIKLGTSVANIIKSNQKAIHIKTVKDIYEYKGYMVLPNIGKREMYVMIKDDAITEDILCAYFHAVLLSIIICAINDVALTVYKKTGDELTPFAEVCQTLQAANWSRDVTESIGFSGFTYEPSYELLRYVNNIVGREWETFVAGLMQTGWDINKHLLMVDEWRVFTNRLDIDLIQQHDRATSGALSSVRLFHKEQSFGDVIKVEENYDKEFFTIEPSPDSRRPSRLPPQQQQNSPSMPSQENLMAGNTQKLKLN